ncbi:MAG: diguanylate cyclase [Deltaproteobacteria bacterium]|nr:diguanylate cyclase [Deltaproteobacteria bacterium]
MDLDQTSASTATALLKKWESEPNGTREKKRILVVDDEPPVRRLLKKALTQFGYDVLTADDGLNALSILHNESVTTVLTDLNMPNMGGLELISVVKKEFPEIDIIAMTGFSKDYRYIDVINAGACDFINKPFDLEEIEAKLQRVALERSLKHQLIFLSMHDEMTGLYNKRYFNQRIIEEMGRAERQGYPLSLLLLDIDKYKKYNDTFGHVEGDAALARLGQILNGNVRRNVDSAFRVGGDEFAVIVPEAKIKESSSLAERLRTSYEAAKLGETTISIGVSEYYPGLDAKSFYQTTDAALYRAKSLGGNRVVADQENYDSSWITNRRYVTTE